MAIELITGRAGEAHVDSADVRAYQAYTAGPGTYRLHGADASMETANSVLIKPGEILAEGCHIRVTGEGERVTIDNGNSNYSRIDLVCLHYTATGAGDSLRESMVFTVVKGTPATSEPAEPDLPGSGSVLDGSNDVYIPFARVTLDGLTPSVEELADQYSLPVSQGGTGATTTDDAIKSIAPAVSALQSKVFPNMTVTATRRGNVVTLRVIQQPASEEILTGRAWGNIAQLKSDCCPTDEVLVLCGTKANSGAWLQMRVTTTGAVQIRNFYGGDTETWSLLAATVSFTCKVV